MNEKWRGFSIEVDIESYLKPDIYPTFWYPEINKVKKAENRIPWWVSSNWFRVCHSVVKLTSQNYPQRWIQPIREAEQ